MKTKAGLIIAIVGLTTSISQAAIGCDGALASTPFGELCNKLVTKSAEIGSAFSNNANQIHFIGGGESGNNFGGFFVMESNPELAVPVTLGVDGGTQLTCKNKINGYYYSAARGNILFPTNNSLLEKLKAGANGEKYRDINIEGGFYSNCNDQYNNEKHHNTIVGNIQYKINNQPQPFFSLTAGRQYDLENNKMNDKKDLVGNFQLKDNAYPIGFFYDSDFGVSFLGGKISIGTNKMDPTDPNYSSSTPEVLKREGIDTIIKITNIFSSKQDILDQIKEFTDEKIIFKDKTNSTLPNGNPDPLNNNIIRECYPGETAGPDGYCHGRGTTVTVDSKKLFASLASIIGADGIISFSDANTGGIIDSINKSKKLIYTTGTNNDIIVTKSNSLNISDYLNKARTNAEILCRGKWNQNANNDINGDVCIDATNGSKIFNINNDLTQNGTPVNIVIKSAKGDPSTLVIKSKQDGKGYLNVFMDNGVLLIKNTTNNGNLTKINSQGTISQAGDNLAWYYGNMIRGNFALNGIMAGTDDGTNLTGINNRIFVDGTFGSLNTIGRPIQAREDLITSNLGSIYNQYISLTKIQEDNGNIKYPGVLAWSCNVDSTNLSSDGTTCINDKVSAKEVNEDLPYNAWYIRANGNLASFITQ